MTHGRTLTSPEARQKTQAYQATQIEKVDVALTQLFSPERVKKSREELESGDYMTIEELTVKLHEELGKTLLAQIESGKASSGVLAAAIKWLKDQNMVINVGNQGLPTESTGPSLVEDLPFHDEIFKKA